MHVAVHVHSEILLELNQLWLVPPAGQPVPDDGPAAAAQDVVEQREDQDLPGRPGAGGGAGHLLHRLLLGGKLLQIANSRKDIRGGTGDRGEYYVPPASTFWQALMLRQCWHLIYPMWLLKMSTCLAVS